MAASTEAVEEAAEIEATAEARPRQSLGPLPESSYEPLDATTNAWCSLDLLMSGLIFWRAALPDPRRRFRKRKGVSHEKKKRLIMAKLLSGFHATMLVYQPLKASCE